MSNRKQNRCSQHSQQIVALCVDPSCNRTVKAVCPLELYNDHLDHKFENISKIHSEWSLSAGDLQVIESNIARETMVKFMDSIIDELLMKIKQHLFLVRKELDLKMGIYFSSNPVQKIKTALNGIAKCLEQRFLELKHEEIQNAKFFVEVYGMKKLTNDTLTQKHTFEKEILIAFAKIKQQMFMDYPKFNALVKAKEYEYCELIKAQKIQISVLKQQLSQASSGLQGANEQRKQLTYEFGRTTNELKNKQIALQETHEKLKLMTTKYNEQAQQAILKARQIKTKNILGTHTNKNLFRVSDRVLKTGDREMDWPGFSDIGPLEGKIFVKLSRFDVGSWVLLGIMDRKRVQKNQYQFDNYKALDHGCYLMDNNRWSYSDTDQNFNCKPLGFEFSQGDIIKLQIFQSVIRFSRMVFGWEEDKFELPFERSANSDLVYCVAVKGEHTQIALV